MSAALREVPDPREARRSIRAARCAALDPHQTRHLPRIMNAPLDGNDERGVFSPTISLAVSPPLAANECFT